MSVAELHLTIAQAFDDLAAGGDRSMNRRDLFAAISRAHTELADTQSSVDVLGGSDGGIMYSFAQEGSYFKALSPTPGTGIAQSIQTTFLATNGILNIFNNNANGGKNIHLDFVRLINTVIGASTTRSECLVSIDRMNRYSSGGALLTPVNVNSVSDLTSNAVIRFGALTLTAESAAIRRLARAQLRAVIMVQFEEWVLDFGASMGTSESLAGGITGALRNYAYMGPCVIAPQNSGTIHLWNTANAVTAPSWECEIGYIER